MTLDEMLNPDTIRLHAGEMTPQEMLTAQALIRWAYGEGQRAADERAAQIAEMTPDMMGTSQQIAAAIRNRKEQG